MGFSDADMMGRGGKTGSGRQASESQENQMRRERLRKVHLLVVEGVQGSPSRVDEAAQAVTPPPLGEDGECCW